MDELKYQLFALSQVVQVVVSEQLRHPDTHASQPLLVAFVTYAAGQVVAQVVAPGCM